MSEPVRPGSLAAWSQAIGVRRGFLLITPLPIVVGALAAGDAVGHLRPLPVLGVLLGAWLLHAGTNLANDFWDHISGTDDVNIHLTPFAGGTQTIQQGLLPPGALLVGALGFLAAGLLAFAGLAWAVHPGIGALAVAGALCGYFYTAPPVSLAHRGLGELTVGLNFGPMLAATSSLAAVGEVRPEAVFAGLLLLPLSVAVLLVAEVPDTPADRATGKHHLLVRFGERAGVGLARGLLVGFHGLLVMGVLMHVLPAPALLALAGLPRALRAGQVLDAGLEAALARPADQPGRYEPFLPALRATLGTKFLCGWLLAAGLLLGGLS